MRYLLGVDVGTTSLKAVLFDENTNPVKTVVKDYTLNATDNIVEFPAEQYWTLFSEALEEISKDYDVFALSIDTQCETLIVTDSEGTPLTDAIVWLDNRAVAQAEAIEKHFGEQKVYEVTGQPEIIATWPAAKLLWLKENRQDIWPKIDKIFLLEDYLLYRLTGEFVTEKTLQSSTIYYDIHNDCWWKEMLDFIGVSENQLPKLCNSGELVGEYKGIKIATSAMDQVAGAIGAGAVKITEKIDLVINIEQWDVNKVYDRMGLENHFTEILELKIPSLTIPVKPGRNLAVIIEVAAMNNRQKKLGYNAAEDLLKRLGMTDDEPTNAETKAIDPF